MSVLAPRPGRLLWFCLVFLFWPSLASAWVETVVRSHRAQVTVERDGTAEVRHELMIKLRGGPLRSIEVAGIGVDVEPLPDATVNRTDPGAGPLTPLEVSTTEEGALQLGIVSERGIRGGSYLFRFAYRTSLHKNGGVAPLEDGIGIRFTGPRLSSGVDAAQLSFSLPRGSFEPRLPAHAEGPAAGILLNQIRRGVDRDEIDLARAHLAVGEPAVWQVIVAPDAMAREKTTAPHAQSSVPVVERALSARPGLGLHLLIASGVMLLFGVLSWLKFRAAEQAAKIRAAQLRPLLPGRAVVRASLASLAVGGAVFLALEHRPTGAAVLACFALLTTTHLLPVRLVRPRGPGEWKPLSPEPSLIREDLPGAFFEPSRLPGFLCLSGIWLVSFGGAYRLLSVSPYLSLMTALGALLWVPLFWTGRHRDLPERPSEQGQRWFRFLYKRFTPELAQVELWGRTPQVIRGDEPIVSEPALDEVRVRIVPASPRSGLRALEVALEEGAGVFVMPCVVVRVLEDSPAEKALPADVSWTRGIRPDEKVALVRPSVPTPKQLFRLARSLTVALSRSDAPPRARSVSNQKRSVEPMETESVTNEPLAAI